MTIENVEWQEITWTKLILNMTGATLCIPTMFIVYYDTSRVVKITSSVQGKPPYELRY